MEKDRCILYRFFLLVMLPVLVQLKGLESNYIQPYPGRQENATKKSVDVLLDSGVNRLLQGNGRIDDQRPFDEDVTREYQDVRDDPTSSEILGEVASKQGSKEEILDNVRPFKSHKGDDEMDDETPFGKEMNKEKNKALSLQIEAPESLDDKQQASDGSDEKNAEAATRKTLQIYIAEEQADQQRRSNHSKRIHRIPKAGNGTAKQNIKTMQNVKTIHNTGPVTHHNKSINVTTLNYTGSAVQDTRPIYRPKNNATKVVLENKAPNRHAVLHEALLAHNHLRFLHHVAPLQWNVTLAAKAQEIADSVATDPSTFEGEPEGENIAQIWHDLPRAPLKAIGIWYSEKAHFSFSYPQLNDKVKHFTQMVWGSTNQLGMGAAPSPSGKYVIVVALYWPLGNDSHRIRDNVHRAGDISDVYATIKETISRPGKDNDTSEYKT